MGELALGCFRALFHHQGFSLGSWWRPLEKADGRGHRIDSDAAPDHPYKEYLIRAHIGQLRVAQSTIMHGRSQVG